MTEPNDPPTFALLADARLTDTERTARLLPRVYDELRQLAQQVLRGERPGHTLQPTALVHEAFLKLVGPRDVPWQSRAHFFSAAAESMRRILIDHARARTAHKRGGPDSKRAALSLDGFPHPDSEQDAEGLLVLDAAIQRLAAAYPDAAQVVRLRYFAGLDVADTAAALAVSAPTVKRTWAFARGWLRDAIEHDRG